MADISALLVVGRSKMSDQVLARRLMEGSHASPASVSMDMRQHELAIASNGPWHLDTWLTNGGGLMEIKISRWSSCFRYAIPISSGMMPCTTWQWILKPPESALVDV